MLLANLVDSGMLMEMNLANAGKDEIVVTDADGNEVDVIHSFDRILDRFIKATTSGRTPAEVRLWFERNFKNWIKKGAKDRGDVIDDKTENLFQTAFYVPIEEYIQQLMNHEPGLVANNKLSPEVIMQSFPEYIRNNPAGAIVFSGGRLFRLKRISDLVQSLHDYMVAVSQVSKNPNPDIMPPDFVVKRLDVLQVPEALRRSIAWHQWVEQNKQRVSYAEAIGLVNSLETNKDFKYIEKVGDTHFIQLLTVAACKAEGAIMKHCVASYGHDVEQGKTTILSARDSNNVPVATLEVSDNWKSVKQLKGKHNSTVDPAHHSDIRKFIRKHKMSVGPDARNIGGMKEDQQ